jgi:phage recombination protein Bet
MARKPNTTDLAPVNGASSAIVAARLPISAATLAEVGVDQGTWMVLCDSIFPSAKTPEGVALAVRYCKARGLDVMKRPVHVVPMYSKALNREVETVWPGIAEVQITASRTGLWAGMDPPRFGPDKSRVFRGTVYVDGRKEQGQVEVTYPEWVEVTVYRIVGGVRAAFSETVFWEESYGRASRGGEVPNDMWQKRPRGQLLKCGKAASLRAAFPEEAGYTAEEMAGRQIEGDIPIVAAGNGVVIDVKPTETVSASVPDSQPTAATVAADHGPTDAQAEEIEFSPPRAPPPPGRAKPQPAYAAMIEQMDSAIGRVLDALERQGVSWGTELKGHPSMSRYLEEGYEIITL